MACRWVACVVFILLGLLSVSALADELGEFDKARNPYDAGRYDEAAERFAELLDPRQEPTVQAPLLVERSRYYYAASLIALGRMDEADRQFEAALRENPATFPDRIFPTEVLDRFTDVRAKLREELEAKARAEAERLRLEREERLRREEAEKQRLVEIERMARQEVHVVRNSRWVAMLPLGAGQFQNDQPVLGAVFLSAEVALAATTVVTSGISQSLVSQSTQPNVDKADLNQRLDSAQQINNIAWGALVAVTLGGIAHAQATFVPEVREMRQRPLPKPALVEPSVSALPGGASLGVRGLF